MAQEKLKNVKFANSVRLNTVENHYYNHDRTDIYLDGIVVKLVDKNSQDVMCSSLMNVISFVKLEDLPAPEPKPSKK